MFEFKVLTLFPEMFSSFLSQSLLQKAIQAELLKVSLINFREYGIGKHKKVDDSPYGGGAGMVLRPDPIYESLSECESDGKTRKVLISPQGALFNQEKARSISELNIPCVLICGRYEGFDERVRDFADEEVSLGDFILMGGEVAAMAVIESVGRLLPGVLGNAESLATESFGDGVLEYDQYTKPPVYNSREVPEVLFSGNHGEIEKWRKQNSLEKTKRKRPDILN